MARHVDRSRIRSAAIEGAATGVVDAWRTGDVERLSAAVEVLAEALGRSGPGS